MKQPEFEFCMGHFKIAIAVLAVFIVIVLYWAMSTCKMDRVNQEQVLTLAAAGAPAGGNITMKAKMTHKYWGNCNMCHVTVDVPKKPVSQVFQGPPISVSAKMTHKYWGNCNMCHQVSGGLKQRFAPAPAAKVAALAAGAPPPIMANAKPTHPDWGTCSNCHQILKPGQRRGRAAALAAFAKFSARSVGLDLKNVNSALMGKWGLSDEEGVLVLTVHPGSIAQKAGFKKGDEIVRLNDARIDTIHDFDIQLALSKPDDVVKAAIYRGRRSKNIFMDLKPQGNLAAATSAPMTQNRIETLAERFNVPKTQAAVEQALRRARPAAANVPMTHNRIETLAERFNVPKTQAAVERALRQARPAALANSGKVIVAALGPGLYSQTSLNFENSPYFILYDPVTQQYKSLVNPNYNDTRGNSRQTSHLMVDLGASNVIAGSFTSRSADTLRMLRLNLYSGVTGVVKDVLNMYKNGQIQQTNIHATTRAGFLPTLPTPPTPPAPAGARGAIF
ncbi:magnetosome protein MamP [Candidatus Desulfarcum epimagneticum]|uniref:Magnetosome protein MamP n=1 Tax=uncultured Desulfobacteraceae bacterium TaxID=218296 RepID=A0A484HI57_9BACT|nr:magnetosome protein MamP [uncultured Desulfobacteraceae bacterium]